MNIMMVNPDGGAFKYIIHGMAKDRKGYYLDIEGVGQNIPVLFSSSEMEFGKYILPMILVRREEPVFAAIRWPSVGMGEYAVPVGEIVVVDGVTSRTRVEQKAFAYPFDITYTVEGISRLRNQSVNLLNYLLRIYKPYGKVFVVDSLGERRSYEAFMEGTANLDELVDVAERMSGFAITLRVEAELDLSDPFTQPSVRSKTINLTPVR